MSTSRRVFDLRLMAFNICKSYNGEPVLRDCSFPFDKSGTYVLMGPNGSGKSTFLRICTLLEEPDKQKYLILMDHSPLDIYEAAARGVDLHVAGHTHGGQMYPFGLLTERAYAFDYGQLIKDSYHLIVSSGAGTWGPPVRIGTRSEVVLIEIRRK